MRKQLGLKKGQAGFSLVELMVVVAIIGVLATIAIPRVNRFIAKSRQSEAQVNLSSLYTFNKNFFVEFSGYTSDFTSMGFKPEGQIRYNTGFSGSGEGPQNFLDLKPGTAYGNPSNSADDCAAHPDRCTLLRGSDNSDTPMDLGASTIDTGNFTTFTAEAAAMLIGADTTLADRWTITNNKLLQNTNDGTVEND